jgi:hypothetical protein
MFHVKHFAVGTGQKRIIFDDLPPAPYLRGHA